MGAYIDVRDLDTRRRNEEMRRIYAFILRIGDIFADV